MSANGPSRYLEVERKFDVDASTPPPSFDGLEGIARIERAETQSLDAVYFDTDEGDLASNRITLRRRTGGLDRRPPVGQVRRERRCVRAWRVRAGDQGVVGGVPGDAGVGDRRAGRLDPFFQRAAGQGGAARGR